MNSREICVSPHCAPQGGPILTHPHMPEKSGFPSAVRGAGAEKSGVPSAFFGTPFVGYPSHCACKAGVMARDNRRVAERMVRVTGMILVCTVRVNSERETRGRATHYMSAFQKTVYRGGVDPVNAIHTG